MSRGNNVPLLGALDITANTRSRVTLGPLQPADLLDGVTIYLLSKALLVAGARTVRCQVKASYQDTADSDAGFDALPDTLADITIPLDQTAATDTSAGLSKLSLNLPLGLFYQPERRFILVDVSAPASTGLQGFASLSVFRRAAQPSS